MGTTELDDTVDLRYIEADHVRCPAGTLAEFDVCTADAERLGNVSGVLVNPHHRRCEYFVVESTGLLSRRRFLVPLAAGAIVEAEPKTLRIVARKDELALEPFTARSVPEFTDEDAIRTMFSRDAA